MKNVEKSLLVSNLITYSVVHGIVDLVSAAIVFSFLFNGISRAGFVTLAIVYNVFAFGTQAVLGHILDTYHKPKEGALFSLFLLLGGLLFTGISPMFSVILAGLGNALFHVGGGIISLNLTPKRATAPGIYVSIGAFGLFVGTLMGKSFSAIYLVVIPLFVLSYFMILFTKTPKIDYKKGKVSGKFRYFELIVILLLLVVVSRAFVGMMLIFSWKSNILLATILILSIVLGKALGGFFADKFGWIKVSVIALIISAPLLTFAGEIYPLAILGAFLFNFSMPVTLTALSNTIPGRPGFAFGLTTIALLIGAIPALVGFKEILYSSVLLFVVILASAGILLVSLGLYYKRKV